MTDTCQRCAGPVARPTTGRPPKFCGIACRRAAEYEVRRISRHLERLETEAADARMRLTEIGELYADESEGFRAHERKRPAARLTALDTEIRATESRLAALLADEEINP